MCTLTLATSRWSVTTSKRGETPVAYVVVKSDRAMKKAKAPS